MIEIEINGFTFLGVGSEATGDDLGWQTADDIYFRCSTCGSLMHSVITDYWNCKYTFRH